MVRAAVGLNVIETAERSGAAPNTITRYENGTDAYGSTLVKRRRAFEKAGLAFIDGTRWPLQKDASEVKRPRRG